MDKLTIFLECQARKRIADEASRGEHFALGVVLVTFTLAIGILILVA